MTILIPEIRKRLQNYRSFTRKIPPSALILLPLLVWFGVFWKYLCGDPAMTRHGMDYYFIIKYYLENLTRGVFPFWDPFGGWGRPDDIDQLFIGEFNPFLWLYPFFSALPIGRPAAFILYMFVYFQIGVWGFYLLAKRLFHDHLLALVSATLLMFSSAGFPVFNNYCITLLFVPVIWFFYFLLAFAQESRRHFFLGLIFSSALIAITYMPFYFLTLLQPFLLGMFLLFYRDTLQFFGNLGKFIRQNKLFVVLCLIFLALAIAPGVEWYLHSASGEEILSWRHANAGDAHTASMNLFTIQANNMSDFMTIRGLFSNLSESKHLVFFVPVAVYLFLLLAVGNPVNRRQILLLLMAAWLFLIVLSDLTPVHKFLYDHIYFYRLFRNLIYFIYIGVPGVILFCVEQLRLLLQPQKHNLRQKTARLTFILGLHGLFLVFVARMGDIIGPTYMTIGLSALFFSLYEIGFLSARRQLATFLLLFFVIIQPAAVFNYSVKNALSVVPWMVTDRFTPKFSYLRPSRLGENFFKGKSPNENQDSSGFMPWKYTGLRWSYDLHRQVNQDILEKYTRYKFVVYDQAVAWEMGEVDYHLLEDAFNSKTNKAFVLSLLGMPRPQPIRPAPTAQFIEQGSEQLTVTQFDLNRVRLRTNFDSSKFLVYNDSYHRDWKALVNGQSTAIYLANGAFKGIWLPPGKNEVLFSYGSWIRYAFAFFMLGLFTFVLAFLGWLSFNQGSRNPE